MTQEIEQEPNTDTTIPAPDVTVTPPADDAITDDGVTPEAPEYVKTPEEVQRFLVKLLNHIIDFIVRLFSK